MEKGAIQNSRSEELAAIFRDKPVVLIAPGKSSTLEEEAINRFVREINAVTISVNFDYKYLKTDFIFLSNIRRFKELEKSSKEKCIVTSNIPFDGVYYQTDYKSLLNGEEFVNDNAGLMVIKLLISFGAKKVLLAGFDGYSHEPKENYADSVYVILEPVMYFTKNLSATDITNYFKEILWIVLFAEARRMLPFRYLTLA